MTNITLNSATSGGTVTSKGSGTVSTRGICWSTHSKPTVADNKTTDGDGAGTFTSNLTGLMDNTIYYLRAYVTSSISTYYGDLLSFTTKSSINGIIFNPNLTYGTMTDIDGNTYKTTEIGSNTKGTGTQIWMVENLKTTSFKDGSKIPIEADSIAFSSLSTPAYCWYGSNNNTYGPLYNWYAVNTGNLCPTGWHIPTDVEWKTLSNYLGGAEVAGDKLKESGTSHWKSPNKGTNESGFTALPGGFILAPQNYGAKSDNSFGGIGQQGQYWTSTTFLTKYVLIRVMDCTSGTLFDNQATTKDSGLSVRCLKD